MIWSINGCSCMRTLIAKNEVLFSHPCCSKTQRMRQQSHSYNDCLILIRYHNQWPFQKISEMFIHRIAEELKQQQNKFFICLQFIDVFAIRIYFNILSNIIMKKTVNAKKENSKKQNKMIVIFNFSNSFLNTLLIILLKLNALIGFIFRLSNQLAINWIMLHL